MTQRRRLPDLTVADAGRRFIMRPGSRRYLVLSEADVVGEDSAGDGPQAEGPVRVQGLPAGAAGNSRYEIEALERGRATVRLGEREWTFEIRGPRHTPEQTRDDTDAGWGEQGEGYSAQWWQEQRPPHW